jgi:hypothetical protein
MKKTLCISLTIALIFLCFGLIEGQKIKTVDGVTVISNGKKPNPPNGQPVRITLQEELSIGQGENPDESFSEVSAFVVDRDGNIYALDIKDRKIKTYDKTGKFLRLIGKPGQGPGELSLPSGIHLTGDNNLLIEDALNRRLALFKTSGEFIKNISLADKLGLVGIVLDTKGNILGREMGLTEGNANMFFEIKKYGPDLKPLFTLDKIEFPVPTPGSGKKIKIMDMLSVFQFDARNNVYYGRNAVYDIKVYSPEGKHIRTIQKEYEPVKVTQKDIDEMLQRIGSASLGGANINDMFTFPEYFPPFQSFFFDDQGRMQVRTYTKGKAKGEYEIDVFDGEGRFIAQYITRSDLRVWQGSKAYGIEEADDGFRVIKRYAVSWE